MKKIFTIILVLAVFASYGQRAGIQADRVLSVPPIGLQKDAHLDTLLPGNWANATSASVYWFSEEAGYVFGTNTYGDKAYGQQFSVDDPMHLTGGIFWIAYADGTVGNVVFTVWDFVDGAPGEVLGSKSIPISDVIGSTTLDNAMVVEFDEPIAVDGDFVVGVDFSELEGYVPNTKRLAQVSSTMPSGGGLGLVWVKESDDGWFDVMGYTNPIDVDLGIFPFVVPANGNGDGYTVTFNVDMTGVEDFDPAIHEVWVTGNFAGWNEPGTGNSVQMAPAPPAKNTPPFTLSESFEGYDDWVTSISPWTTLQLSNGPTYSAENFDFPGEGGEWAWKVFNPSLTTPPINANFPAQDGSKYLVAIQYTSTNDNKWLISPEVSINETSQLSFWARTYTAQYGLERIQVLVSTTNAEPGSFTKISAGDYLEVPITWTEYTYDLSAYAGQTIYFAIRYMSYDAFIFMLDNIKLTAEVAPQDDLIYTATVQNVPAGELQYKYFSDAFGAGWDGGEWDGEPNRSVMVDGDLVLNDVWGDPTVSVDEIQLDMVTRVYPNPVRNTLFIQSEQQIDHLRMFDLAGRLVYQTEVMDFETTIDANQLRGGLYILQMISGQQVKTHKIQVVK